MRTLAAALIVLGLGCSPGSRPRRPARRPQAGDAAPTEPASRPKPRPVVRRARPRGGGTTDFLTLATVPVDQDLSGAAAAPWVRYALRLPPQAAPPPETLFQEVRRTGPGHYEVTVRRMDLRHLPPRPSARPGPSLKRYLQPTATLQANAPLIRHLAAQAKGRGLVLARNLTRLVASHIRQKGYALPLATALDVARLRQGDCTEHAMLLAAMARARGLPSRLASGLVYSSSFAGRTQVFVYHMWTEIHVAGRWIPFDATRPDEGVGPTHLLLALDAGDSLLPAAAAAALAATLGQTEIRVLAVGH